MIEEYLFWFLGPNLAPIFIIFGLGFTFAGIIILFITWQVKR